MIKNIRTITTFIAIWVIWNEGLNWPILINGLLVSIAALLLSNYFLDEEAYPDVFSMSVLVYIGYFLHLIKEIYKSGITAMVHIVRGNDSVCLSDYSTSLENEYTQSLLANAITLTPGTVSVDKSKDVLTILSFVDKEGKALVNYNAVQQFEKILRGREE